MPSILAKGDNMYAKKKPGSGVGGCALSAPESLAPRTSRRGARN